MWQKPRSASKARRRLAPVSSTGQSRHAAANSTPSRSSSVRNWWLTAEGVTVSSRAASFNRDTDGGGASEAQGIQRHGCAWPLISLQGVGATVLSCRIRRRAADRVAGRSPLAPWYQASAAMISGAPLPEPRCAPSPKASHTQSGPSTTTSSRLISPASPAGMRRPPSRNSRKVVAMLLQQQRYRPEAAPSGPEPPHS